MSLYTHSTPADLDSRQAILPLGALEWHGPHLPLGLDGLVAEAFAKRLADRVGGTVFPVQWWAMTPLPHASSFGLSTATFCTMTDEILAGLLQAFDRVVVISGHYAQGHMIELYEAARRAGPAYVATPLEPLDDADLLDHAGRTEAAQLLAIFPELVHLDRLPERLRPHEHAVLGPHPAGATAEEGHALFERALEAWESFLSSSPESLSAHYERQIAQYASYRERFYRESWEQAIADWWATKAD